jgi:hypothetical protein
MLSELSEQGKGSFQDRNGESMSRFHDEFFKQRGTRHDKLMMKAVSNAGIEKILGEKPVLEKQEVPKTAKALMGKDYNGNPVLVCDLETDLPSNVKYAIEQRGVEIAVHESITEKIDYETEVICRSGSFIVGYADILIKYRIDHRATGSMDGYEASRHLAGDRKQVLVELKPALDDIGAVLRQLKTYESILRGDGNFEKVIVTYDQQNEDLIEYLKHEGVRLIRFEES